ncbi:DNA-processing protein DprA, partial [Nocardia arizonensis]|uniref:DNA-processing protein DprA n=1 Tax=Nocardia arizonensis TaxID=1141647 RepID=UPI000AD547EE
GVGGLARAALTPAAYPRAVAATRAAAPDIEDAAEQIGSLAAEPRSRASIAELAEGDIDRAERAGAWLLTPDDPAWACLGFDDLDAPGNDHLDAPVAVWVRGTVEAVSVLTRVGIVGARAVSPRGAAITGQIAGDLVERGVHIVSGGAYGVDVIAHRAALDRGVATTLVSATGIDRVYPSAHLEVFDAIAQTGAIISEYPPRDGVEPSRLLARNRLVAAMSRQLVVTEAGVRSGTLSTARWARRLHRPALAVPADFGSAARGCDLLISEGHARPVRSLTEILTALGETAEPETHHRLAD